MKKRTPPCPPSLKENGRKQWTNFHDLFEFTKAERKTLEMSLTWLDKFYDCKTVIDEGGCLYQSARGTKRRPEMDLMKVAWTGYLSGLKSLGIDQVVEQPKKQHGAGHPVDNRYTIQGPWTQKVNR